MKNYKNILIIIVLSQFCCTSLWFASNAVISQLINTFNLQDNALGHLTSAVNFGFIIGTLIYAIFNLADRFPPSRVFFISAIFAALFNLVCVLKFNTIFTLLMYRFLTGFFLAGIYPVGMKIASDYSKAGLGKALGFLVGALVLGTASPHILKEMSNSFSWEIVFVITTILALLGGVLMFTLVPNGPYMKTIDKPDFKVFFTVFKNTKLKKAAFGYFGHMWELYTFWAFVPVILAFYKTVHKHINFSVPLYAFIIIALGSLSCILGGYISQVKGVQYVARFALKASFVCCILSPFIFLIPSVYVFMFFMCLWGMFVIADSPMFSTLVAQSATLSNKGTAITIVNCLGFAISILSIQTVTFFKSYISINYVFVILAVGPLVGLVFSKSKKESV